MGVFYRLLSPFEGNDTAWIVVSEDKTEALAAFYQTLNKVNDSWLRLKLQGLDENTLYEVKYWDKTLTLYGDELMNMGLPIDRYMLTKIAGDFASVLIDIKKV